MYTKFIILLLLAICSDGALAQNEPKVECGKTKITCVCGIGVTKRHITLEMKMNYVDDPVTEKAICVATEDPYQACASVSCLPSPNNAVSSAKNGLISHFYPYEFTIPSGGVKHRFTRETGPCHLTPQNHSVIKCWKWPDWIDCYVTCIYGYVFPDGAETININCRSPENTWNAGGFQDCEPYLNCNVELMKPGELRCEEPLNAPPYCEISCLDYDEYEAISPRKYECVDDSFASKLPHCASLKPTPKPLKPKPTKKPTTLRPSKRTTTPNPTPITTRNATRIRKRRTRTPKTRKPIPRRKPRPRIFFNPTEIPSTSSIPSTPPSTPYYHAITL